MAQPGTKKPLTCSLCGTAGPRQFYHENGYRYFRCRSCALLFLWPQPDSPFLHDHYQEYLPVAESEVAAWGREMEPVIRDTARDIEKLAPNPGKLLDIGCGYGFFLAEMKRRGWQVEGVELSRPAADIARAKTGAAIHSCAVEEMALADPFDVITLFYVIEHVADPVAILQAVGKLLKPGGVLVLRYPNTSPLLAFSGRLARKLRLMQAPSHLYDYNGRSMGLLLEQAGFSRHRTTLNTNTRPANLAKWFISCYIGLFSVLLARMTNNRVLLPGFSRTTFAAREDGPFQRS